MLGPKYPLATTLKSSLVIGPRFILQAFVIARQSAGKWDTTSWYAKKSANVYVRAGSPATSASRCLIDSTKPAGTSQPAYFESISANTCASTRFRWPDSVVEYWL